MAALPFVSDLMAPQDDDWTPSLHRPNFGDGYQGRARTGKNNDVVSFRVTWKPMADTDAETLTEALRALGGVTPVEWTPKSESAERQFYVDSYSRSYVTDGSIRLQQVQAVLTPVHS